MPLRIPEREQPKRITIGEAFAYLVSQTIKPGCNIDIAGAVHFANIRVYQRTTLTAVKAQSGLFSVNFLDTDPLDIASSIWDGIVSRNISINGFPSGSLVEQWTDSPTIHDWATGLASIAVGDQRQRFYPTLDRLEVDALFSIEGKDAEQSAPVTKPNPVIGLKRATGKKPIAKAAIKARILAALRAGKDIGDRDHDAITTEFGEGASRGTCVAALREALSEFHAG